MIAIINTGERDASGAYRYRLQINHTLIAEFHHQRIDGLAVCLRRAAQAAEQADGERAERLLAELERPRSNGGVKKT